MIDVLEHRLVAGYLRDLDAALAGLPAAAAAELAEQLRAHLPEALPPDADEDAVMAVLAALGPARTWLAVAAVTIGVGFPAGTLTLWQVQPSVQFRGGSAWWNPVDGARVVQTEADGATQYTVPLRPGKIQGFAIFVYNPSPITQVITGSADIISPGAPVPPQIGVATTGTVRTGDPHAVSYRAGGPIPPHSYRWVRVLWRSALCYLEAAGGSEHIPLGGECRWKVLLVRPAGRRSPRRSSPRTPCSENN